MKPFRFTSNLLAATLLALLFTSVASAQATRTWVSGAGLDTNPCSRTAPCKTFPRALTQTATGGEIDCLDAGDFGNGGGLTILQAVTIDCGGAIGSISSVLSSVLISIFAGTMDVVTLRNLSVNGAAVPGGIGIHYGSGKAVRVENVRIYMVGGTCLASDTSAASILTVDNATLSGCDTGITVRTVSGNAVVTVNNTRIIPNTAGIALDQNSVVTVTGSSISGGSGPGISQTFPPSEIFVTGSTIASMGTALQSSPGCFIGASGNTFTNNGMIYNQNGGQIFTGSDNPMFGNGALGSTFGAVPKG